MTKIEDCMAMILFPTIKNAHFQVRKTIILGVCIKSPAPLKQLHIYIYAKTFYCALIYEIGTL